MSGSREWPVGLIAEIVVSRANVEGSTFVARRVGRGHVPFADPHWAALTDRWWFEDSAVVAVHPLRLVRESAALPPGGDPVGGGPWDVGQLRCWADRLEVFAQVSAWLGALADAVEEAERVGAVDGRAPVEEPAPSAPRHGLAGSDEAIEAALNTVDWELIGEPNGTTMASARQAAAHVAVTVAARVRAEAVAEERQRIAGEVYEIATFYGDKFDRGHRAMNQQSWWAATCTKLLTALDDWAAKNGYDPAAGSVPVATPPESDPRCPADLKGARCSLFRGHQDNHATSRGKRGQAALGRRYDGDWFEWADGPERFDGVTEPSVGTGKPAEHWRVGEHYRLHVYAGDQPVATFHQEQDAAKAVAAVNAAPGPGTPAEAGPPASVAQERHELACTRWVSSSSDDEDVSACGNPAVGLARTTSGTWEPICVRHCDGLRAEDVQFFESAGAVSGGSGRTERQASASDDELTRLRTFTAAVDQMLGDMDAAELRAEVHRLMETREEWLRQAATVWEPARFALLVNERDEAVADAARYRTAIEQVSKAMRRNNVPRDEYVPIEARKRLLDVLAAALGDGA